MCEKCNTNNQQFSVTLPEGFDPEKLKVLLAQHGASIKDLTEEHTPTENLALTPVERKKTFAEIIKEYGMTNEQVAFYKKYSMERSRKAYERVAVRELGKDELIDNWVYMGYYDAGFRGADYCSAGHALRYVHIALNKKTQKEIKFGIKCVSDFFNLTPAQIKFIKNGFNEANAEIQQGIDRFVEFKGNWEIYEEKYHFKQKLDFILEHNPRAFILDSDNLIHCLKLAELQYIFRLKLFLPKIWEYKISKAYRQVYHEFNEQRAQIKLDNIDYIKAHHLDIYKIIVSLSSRANPTDKQKYFLQKLMDTPWEYIDDLINQVREGKIEIKPGYPRNTWINIIDSYHLYGVTAKQLALLKKLAGVK